MTVIEDFARFTATIAIYDIDILQSTVQKIEYGVNIMRVINDASFKHYIMFKKQYVDYFWKNIALTPCRLLFMFVPFSKTKYKVP